MARIPKDESERVHDAIVRAAVDEMALHGYAGLRIPEVAERVGKTQGAVYGRFPDKEALAIAALRSIRDKVFLPRVAEALVAERTAIGALERLSETSAAIASADRNGERMLTRLAAELSVDQGPVGREIRDFFTVFADLVIGLFRRAARDGELADTPDLEAVALAAVGMQLGISIAASMFSERTSYAALERAMRPVLTRGVAHRAG